METIIDVTALAERVHAAAEAVAVDHAGLRGKDHRSCADLAAELADVATRCPDAVAEAEALIDIGAREPLAPELCDAAALCAAGLFLGRRLIETNLERIEALCPAATSGLTEATTLAALLDRLSVELLSGVYPLGEVPADAAA